jgi:hypothetical protein
MTTGKEEHGVNPNNWGPYAHLPRPTTDSIEELLKFSDWKLAVKELIIHSAKLEKRVAELETIVFSR